jgi:hypothetical protein
MVMIVWSNVWTDLAGYLDVDLVDDNAGFGVGRSPPLDGHVKRKQ